MLSLRRHHLQALDAKRGIARDYSLELGRDLFGHYTVDISFGRVGKWARGIRYSVPPSEGPDPMADVDRFVRSRLRRRATSTKRIGVAYVPVPGSDGDAPATRSPDLSREGE